MLTLQVKISDHKLFIKAALDVIKNQLGLPKKLVLYGIIII